MKTKEFTEFPINIKVTNEDIASILDKALDEGSLHWIYDASSKFNKNIPPHEVIANDGILSLYGMNGSIYELTKGKFILGLQQAIPYFTNIINGRNLNTGIIDSDGADLILQLALFNEVLFD